MGFSILWGWLGVWPVNDLFGAGRPICFPACHDPAHLVVGLAPLDARDQTFARLFVNDVEDAKRRAVMRAILHEIAVPDMVGIGATTGRRTHH